MPMTDLPYSQEAEEAVLSAVFIDPDVYANAAQILQPDDFYVRRNPTASTSQMGI